MQKIVINNWADGLFLSHEAVMRYAEIKGIKLYPDGDIYYLTPNRGRYITDENCFDEGSIKRDDPILIQVVEELGERASGKYAELVIIEIPDDVEWTLESNDGGEWVAEKHRTWGADDEM